MPVSKFIVFGGIICVLIAGTLLWHHGRTSGNSTVVVYVSEDQVFSEPVLKDFEKETGSRLGQFMILKRLRVQGL